MSIREAKSVKGRVLVVVRDAETGKIIKVIRKDNIITNTGRAYAAEAFAHHPSTAFLAFYMDIGTGICEPTANDQDLCSPIIESREEVSGDTTKTYYFRRWIKGVSIIVQANSIIFHARWLPEDANNYPICEEILFIASPLNLGTLAQQDKWTSPEPLMNITQTIGAKVVQHASFSCVSKTPSILLDIYVTITFT